MLDVKIKTVMDWKHNMEYTKWLLSKTLSWDLAEMIACKCADECLKKRYYYNVDMANK